MTQPALLDRAQKLPSSSWTVRRDTASARSDGGFTLVELLIVIVVLGILATIVLMGTATFRGDAANSACSADETQLEHAALAYKAKTDSWPTGADSAARVAVLTSAGYLRSSPTTGAVLVDNNGTVGGC